MTTRQAPRGGGLGGAGGCVCACHQEHEASLESFGLRLEWFPRSWQQLSVLRALLPPGANVRREQLLATVYGPGASTECPNDARALRVTVHRLRRALEPHGWGLRSIARHGYTLERTG